MLHTPPGTDLEATAGHQDQGVIAVRNSSGEVPLARLAHVASSLLAGQTWEHLGSAVFSGAPFVRVPPGDSGASIGWRPGMPAIATCVALGGVPEASGSFKGGGLGDSRCTGKLVVAP